MFAPWDDGLDPAQLEAVSHGDGPLVVVAGAGTGKTRTLTARVARLLERGVPPERILTLTFTRRAAEEMMSRSATLIGRSDLARRLRGGTFHAVAHQMVSAWAEPLGLAPCFSVLDPADAADVMDLLRDEHGLSGTAKRLPKPATLIECYSRCVNTNRSLTDVVAMDFPWCEPHLAAIAELFRHYVEHKRHHGQLDFDDLLLYWRAALGEPGLGAEIAALFDYVLVDEYQDVNALQVDIVARLCPGGRGLTVVGDDAQAIYGFRGADAGYLGALAEAYAQATVIGLSTNFRSLQPILDLANALRPTSSTGATALRIELRATRPGGKRPSLLRCYDANSEARAVVDAVLERHEAGRRLCEQAVLVRAAHHADLIELELTARRVPYRKYGGLKFLEGAHVKDFVCAARLIDNPADDIAWFRLLRLHEGIGPARARQLLETLPPRRPDATGAWEQTVAAAPPMARVALSATLGGLASARATAERSGRIEQVLSVVRRLVEQHYRDAPARLADLERLGDAARASEDLASFLAGLTLDPPASTSEHAGPPEVDEDFLIISTVHSAKGLEWPVVHLPHLIDGAFPSDMALRSPSGLAEEQRLFYVAITRARDELCAYSPLRMPHHRSAGDDRHSLALVSRFLDEDAHKFLTVQEEDRRHGRIGEPARLTTTATRAAIAAAVSLEGLWR